MSRLILVAVLVFLIAPVSAKNVVCYFHNWAQYRPGQGQLFAKDVNPYLCTHLVFAFSQLSGTKIVPYEVNDDTSNGQWRQFNDLKIANPKLKTMLALGGYSHGPERFHIMSLTQASRSEFINYAINLLRLWNFDGLDLDWEYPGDVTTSDFYSFADLVKETREAFDKEATLFNRKRLLLSVAVAAGLTTASRSYNVTALDQYVDIVNVMTYDYHGLWERNTGLSAPLFSDDSLNVDSTIQWYLGQGLRPSKIHLGMAFFGRSWTLMDATQNYVGAYGVGPGNNGTYTRTGGILAYYEICEFLRTPGATENLNVFGQQNFAYSGNQWVSYDTTTSLGVKIDYLLAYNLGGAMIWSLPEDDFTGQFCGQSRYPLTSYISSRVMNAPDSPTPTATSATTAQSVTTTAVPTTQSSTATPASSTTASPASTTASPTSTTASPASTTASQTPTTATTRTTILTSLAPNPKNFVCPKKYGFFPDPANCAAYYTCSNGIPLRILCPANTIFNSAANLCENRATTSFVCPV